LDIEYCSDLFSRETINQLTEHYNKLLQSVVDDPSVAISRYEIITENEKQQLLQTFNDTQVHYPVQETVISLFEAQAQKTPFNTALVFAQGTLTYKELDERANRLATYLIDNYQLGPGDLVGIMMDRSEWAVISILGIMKAGAAYVPVEPAYPLERKAYILQETALKLLIIESESIFEVATFNVSICSIDIQFGDIQQSGEPSRERSAGPGDLAYVIYTSGSTGKPKGVMIEHRSLVNYLSYGMKKYSNASGVLNFPLFTSLSFDLTQTSIFLSLLTGGLLRIEKSNDLELVFNNIFNDQRINSLKLTPAHVAFIGNVQSPAIGAVIIGGERLEKWHVQKLLTLNAGLTVFNEYGPTEATIGCTVDAITNKSGHITIGKPIDNTRIYILGANGELQPIGIPGEIYIAGDGLARGYLKHSDLTSERFVFHPAYPRERLYRTGDKARWLPGGNIEYLDRLDDQVKIRGYRIELGEIETVFAQCPHVRQCVVIARKDASENNRLLAYIIPAADYDRQTVESFVSRRLPDYMVPSLIVELDEFPLTINGKVNKRALPGPGILHIQVNEYEAPRNEREATLVAVWQQLLNVERVGIHDDFFKLGGHSLLVIKVIAAISEKFSLNLPVITVFNYPNIAALAAYIDVVSAETPGADDNYITVDL
ncbi:non-ribosomal peptide synthetase, partial [Niastella populi]|uniref:non-ribosomal peptide synthetase n=1 Tax=Niastella populi TaxID=550983 RepID=UPI001055B065